MESFFSALWIIPDNMAVAVHPEFEYDLIRAGDDFYILAKELAAGCAQRFGWTEKWLSHAHSSARLLRCYRR